MNNFFSALPYLYRVGYNYGMVVLIIAYFILTNKRPTFLSFINIANSWLAISLFIEVGEIMGSVFLAWYSQNPYEGYTFQFGNNRSDYIIFLWEFFYQCILLFFIVILFCFKKIRIKVWRSIVMLFILNFFALFFNALVHFFYKRTLISSSSYYVIPFFYSVRGIAVFSLFIGTTYWLINKRAVSKAQL